MKVVIDIPDEIYAIVCEREKNLERYCMDVTGGTPLPKGHGRLIDADALLEQFRDGTEGYDCAAYTRYEIGNIIDLEDTIIEAAESEVNEHESGD